LKNGANPRKLWVCTLKIKFFKMCSLHLCLKCGWLGQRKTVCYDTYIVFVYVFWLEIDTCLFYAMSKSLNFASYTFAVNLVNPIKVCNLSVVTFKMT
jgi:hypothetical protein